MNAIGLFIIVVLAIVAALAGGGCARDRAVPPSARVSDRPAGAGAAGALRVLDRLDGADALDVLALEPYPKPEAGPADGFHRYTVRGRAAVTDPADRARVAAAMRAAAMDPAGMGIGCFSPRHGIRATRGGVTTDFVICFECANVHAYEGTEEVGYFLVGRGPQPLLDDVLRGAGVVPAGGR